MEIECMSLNAEDLLSEIILNLQKLKTIEDTEQNNLNIISILGKESNEVYMCRVLWSILNYDKDKKKVLLASFLKDVLGIDDTDDELENAMVYREYCIPQNSRRIDIAIRTKNHFIPIEAKIYADDQKGQCADYLDYAGNYYTDPTAAKLYYLTKDSRKPSYYSVSYRKELFDQIVPITWKEVLKWLKGLQYLKEDINEVVSQYVKALEELLDIKRGGFNMGLDERIGSAEGIKAAIEIEKSLNRHKKELLKTIYKEILDKIGQEEGFDYDPKLNEPWDYEQCIEEYYYKKTSSSTYPALTFNLGLLETSDDGSQYYLILRYEIAWKSYVGFAIMKRDPDGQLHVVDNPSDNLFNKAKLRIKDSSQLSKGKDWWLYWEYVVSNSMEALESEPDFRIMNEAHLSLFDEEDRKAYVNQVVEILKKFRRNIK